MSNKTLKRREARLRAKLRKAQKKKKGVTEFGAPRAIGFVSDRVTTRKRFPGRDIVAAVYSYTADEDPVIIPLNPHFWVDTAGKYTIQNYERYKFHNLKVRYQPIVGTTTAGAVVLGFLDQGSYSGDTPEATFSTLSRTSGSVKGSIWSSFEARPDMDLLNYKPWGKALKDGPTLQVWAQVIGGPADSSKVGYIELEYDIELYSLTRSLSTWVSRTAGASMTLAASVTTSTYPVGTVFLLTRDTDLGDVHVMTGEYLVVTNLTATENTWRLSRSGETLGDDLTGTVYGTRFVRASEY